MKNDALDMKHLPKLGATKKIVRRKSGKWFWDRGTKGQEQSWKERIDKSEDKSERQENIRGRNRARKIEARYRRNKKK